jgi:hypothetical protein
MKLAKILIPAALLIALTAVAQGTTSVNERFEKLDWMVKSK